MPKAPSNWGGSRTSVSTPPPAACHFGPCFLSNMVCCSQSMNPYGNHSPTSPPGLLPQQVSSRSAAFSLRSPGPEPGPALRKEQRELGIPCIRG